MSKDQWGERMNFLRLAARTALLQLIEHQVEHSEDCGPAMQTFVMRLCKVDI